MLTIKKAYFYNKKSLCSNDNGYKMKWQLQIQIHKLSSIIQLFVKYVMVWFNQELATDWHQLFLGIWNGQLMMCFLALGNMGCPLPLILTSASMQRKLVNNTYFYYGFTWDCHSLWMVLWLNAHNGVLQYGHWREATEKSTWINSDSE